LATISFTLPLTLYYFPHLPLWGPIVNVLAVPLGGFLVVGTGLLAICMWFISPMLAAYIIELSGLCARMLLALIDWFNSLPGADWSLAPMRTHEITAYYSLLLGLCLLRWRSYRRVTVLCLITAIVLWGGGWLWQEIRHWRGRPLEIHFIDVGQGDATLIKFPNGQNMLVDAGGSAFGKVDVGERALYPYLRWLRVNRIDFAVLSHPHPDHFDGFIYIARKIPIGEFWHNGQQIALPRFRVLMQTLQELRVRQRVFHRHQRIDIGGVQIQNLHPLPGPHEGTSYYWVFGGNDNSLVLHLQYKEVSFLLAGDIETRAEEILSERWPNLRVNLLKVPHHGSRTSSTDRLLDLLKPQHAALSLGRMNRYNFPHPSVIERYQQRHIKLWRTDQHGRLHVSTNGKTIQFSAYQQYQKMNH
jgi:competence protein ComEC